MKKLLVLLALFSALNLRAERETFCFEVKRQLSSAITAPTTIDAQLGYLAGRFGYFKASEMTVTAAGTNQLVAEIPGSDEIFNTFTNATGYWFCADGSPATRSGDTGRRVAVKLSDGNWAITHRANTANNTYNQLGDEFTFAVLAIHEADTVRFQFHVTLVDDHTPETVTTDQPQQNYYHRADQNDGLGVTALVQSNDGEIYRQNWLQAKTGDRITLSAAITDTLTYDSVWTRWNNPNGTLLRNYAAEPFVLTESATTALSGQYTLRARCYKKGANTYSTKSYILYIDVQERPGETLSWDGLIPSFGYNFKDEYGEIAAPTQILGEVGTTDRYGKEVNRVSGEWWTTCWGSTLNTTVGTDTATVYQCARNMIAKYDEDFAYIRDEMGWPPDIRARKGYKSTIYIFGSGLNCDNEANTTQGGYQSAIWYSDPITGEKRNWPCVWASYYPFSRFRSDADKIFSDGDYQREAMIHEGIHALFADMDGVKNSAWFHEAGNTWLQSAMTAKRSGTYGTPGFLDGCPFIAPFMPVECYSGWLQDGSFGGPSAEGVNMYNSSGTQLCTWRTWLGGNQYGNSFPIVLSQICGDASIPWIWRYCKNRVLEGIGDSIGDANMRNLIVEYRARQALFDIGPWSTGYRTAADNYFGISIGPEYEPYWMDCGTWVTTCYQRMRVNDNDGWLAPDELTNPGWSGANIIPIHVDENKDSVCIQFRPEDTEERAILCYKTKAGNCYYSQIVRCGDMKLALTERPANNVIFCVVCNTDYKYTGETQRKHHWDYRIRLKEGAKGIADQYKRWYLHEKTITDDDYEDLTGIRDTYAEADEEEALDNHLQLLTGMIQAGGDIRLDVQGIDATEVAVRMVGLQGIVESQGHLTAAGSYTLPANLRHGLYVLAFGYRGQWQTYKVIVR